MLIGLYGPSRAGKDTVAGVLVRNHGFEQRNLASPIRHVLSMINPIYLNEEGYPIRLSPLLAEHDWDFIKKHFPESVDHMIALGQGMRDIDESVWLNACVKDSFDNLVIADVRQPNEADFIYNHGGELWKIEREGSQKRGMDGLLDDYDFSVEIKNDLTLDWLESLVNIIMEGRK